MKQLVKKFMPKVLIGQIRKLKLSLRKTRSAEEVFTDIYLTGKWGKGNSKFFSGAGSEKNSIEPYIACIQGFIAEKSVKSIVDLGCGDFRVGRNLTSGVRYIGCDVVQPVVEENQKQFGSDTVSFIRKDIITDALPEGELCLIRQVFQHLSNDSILKVLPKLSQYKYVIISDALPKADEKKINYDIPNFSGTRDVVHGTGLWLENQPFNLPIRILSRYELPTNDREYLRIALYQPNK